MSPHPAASFAAVPRPLAIGVGMTLFQAAVMVVLVVEQVFSFSSERAGLAFSNMAVFALWAALLIGCAMGLLKLNSVARAPLMAVQLLQLGVAYDFFRGETVWIGACIVASVLVVVVGVLHPASIEAVSAAERR